MHMSTKFKVGKNSMLSHGGTSRSRTNSPDMRGFCFISSDTFCRVQREPGWAEAGTQFVQVYLAQALPSRDNNAMLCRAQTYHIKINYWRSCSHELLVYIQVSLHVLLCTHEGWKDCFISQQFSTLPAILLNNLQIVHSWLFSDWVLRC